MKEQNNNLYKRIEYLIVAGILLLTACISGCAKEETRKSDEIIKEIVSTYGGNGLCFDSKIESLFSELESTDKAKASQWRDILEYWNYVNLDMPIYTGVLPDGLPDDSSLAIVVLGFELNSDGTMQDELIGRLETALRSNNKYDKSYIVCTGGGTASEDRSVTEAGLMGQWLMDNGVDSNRIIIENRSLSTVENALLTNEILQEKCPEVRNVAIVSSSYHIPWGALLFEAVFLKEASEQGRHDMHVISDAAYPIVNERYSDVVRLQTSQLVQLIE